MRECRCGGRRGRHSRRCVPKLEHDYLLLPGEKENGEERERERGGERRGWQTMAGSPVGHEVYRANRLLPEFVLVLAGYRERACLQAGALTSQASFAK